MKKCIKKQWNELEKIDFFKTVGMQFESRMEKRLWKVQSRFYPGDLMTRTGDREIRSVSRRLPDNPGELARMPLSLTKIPWERGWGTFISCTQLRNGIPPYLIT